MKIICVGRNYAAHAKELGNDVPDEPVLFMKPKNALLQGHTPFYYPEFTNELHYECELVLRVCKNGKYIQKDRLQIIIMVSPLVLILPQEIYKMILLAKGCLGKKARHLIILQRLVNS